MHIFPFCSRNLRAPGARVLYLSGSPGTTVSHVSHIVRPFFRLIETTFLSNLMLTGQQFCEDWSTLKKKYISLFEDDLADVDGNGKVDYIEFITVTMHRHKLERDEHLYKAFQHFDKDQRRYICDRMPGLLLILCRLEAP
ncbi:PREDICTED: uncharacterized protein LOC104607657 isoform X2 [Nelumbo nucifera]|uniref:Uncharacterized protein n=2 Tax=Nelumbo nucifera TaxID=4432 RepID=A0A822Y9A5_NELNU|nr:PREDICTED: uncharacterized protein LOC104607657 isoform X2 [Nelumbo nucifera]DAD28852.1 TPA_asm: hypothetical protein HUJ06_030320 [Nelumbo nucifera]